MLIFISIIGRNNWLQKYWVFYWHPYSFTIRRSLFHLSSLLLTIRRSLSLSLPSTFDALSHPSTIRCSLSWAIKRSLSLVQRGKRFWCRYAAPPYIRGNWKVFISFSQLKLIRPKGIKGGLWFLVRCRNTRAQPPLFTNPSIYFRATKQMFEHIIDWQILT